MSLHSGMIFQYNFSSVHYGIILVLFDGNIGHIVWVDDLNWPHTNALNMTKRYLKQLQELTKTPPLQFKCHSLTVDGDFNGYNCGPSLGAFLESFLDSYDTYDRGLKNNKSVNLFKLITEGIKKVTPVRVEEHRSLVKLGMDE